ncbi:hypothetical protein MUK42_34089 [Musa troglodytarum]|uniref:Uncharacterized protein n=1 Tax=Musa troglodytarum TaxID=320322 RepID=A0A9E7FE06_9LILI|nr:hypothetical protein MUK42_34089 [Musa troglodytarum]
MCPLTGNAVHIVGAEVISCGWTASVGQHATLQPCGSSGLELALELSPETLLAELQLLLPVQQLQQHRQQQLWPLRQPLHAFSVQSRPPIAPEPARLCSALGNPSSSLDLLISESSISFSP